MDIAYLFTGDEKTNTMGH